MGPFELEAGANDGQWRFRITPAMLTPARAVQGGVLMGAVVEAIERTTGRPVVWATGRYLRHVGPGATMSVTVTVDVDGHSTTQASAVGTVDGIEVIGVWAAALRLPAAIAAPAAPAAIRDFTEHIFMSPGPS